MKSRKMEPNTSYDDQRGCCYGTDESGMRIRRYKTCPNWKTVRRAPREFHAEQAVNQDVTPQKLTLEKDTGLVAVDRRGKCYSSNAVSLAFTHLIRNDRLPKLTLYTAGKSGYNGSY